MNLQKTLQQFQTRKTEESALTDPILWMGVLIGLAFILFGILHPGGVGQGYCFFAGAFSIVYSFAYFNKLLPLSKRYPFIKWASYGFNIIMLTLLANFEPLSANKLSLVFAGLMIITMAILYGRVESYSSIFLVTAGRLLFVYQNSGEVSWSAVVQLLNIPILGFISTEIILGYKQILREQVKRLEMVNNVSRSVSSSLEINEVIHLVNKTIPTALPADTYFIALKRDNLWCLELFYDNGIFFSPEAIEMNEEFYGTLSGWIARNRQPLLIRNLEKEIHLYQPKVIVRGTPDISKSWMGVPLESSGRLLGGIAVASYRNNAFQESDLAMLQNIGQHVAMAIDNAYHHAEVEQQARIDSLTGVLNHSAFLSDLESAVAKTIQESQTLSLIMLDIDYFKEYNDTYGHVIGDQVLMQITESIRRHIKSGDLVGRWGGEEFAIALPNASGRQAVLVANRIRQTLSNLVISNRAGSSIPAPTVSQGIAVFPTESADFMSLVDLADQRLYLAKNNGRDQVEPHSEYWDQPSLFAAQKTSLNTFG